MFSSAEVGVASTGSKGDTFVPFHLWHHQSWWMQVSPWQPGRASGANGSAWHRWLRQREQVVTQKGGENVMARGIIRVIMLKLVWTVHHSQSPHFSESEYIGSKKGNKTHTNYNSVGVFLTASEKYFTFTPNTFKVTKTVQQQSFYTRICFPLTEWCQNHQSSLLVPECQTAL